MVHQWERPGPGDVDAGTTRWSTVMRTSCLLLVRTSPAMMTAITQVLPRRHLAGEVQFVRAMGEHMAAEYGVGFEVEPHEHAISIRFFRLPAQTGPDRGESP